jgi:hypothetical protein
VVERVDEHRAGLLGEAARRHERVLEEHPLEHHVGAVGPGGPLLRDGRSLGHEHGGLDAQQLGRERDPLGVVAGGRRDHAAGALLG